MPGLHSDILGGSTAARLLNCPASFQEKLKTPPDDTSSVYAQEGTDLHLAIATAIENNARPRDMLGAIFGETEITEERVGVLETALAALRGLEKSLGGRFRTLALEESLPLPGVTGAFGSVDLVLANKTHVIVVDWKFGGGVPVKALYVEVVENGEYDMLNPQLAFYAIAARARHAKAFKGRQIICAVIQPRMVPPITWAATDDVELDGFRAAFEASMLEAIGRDPRRKMGEHCRFAACKATCELWTGPALTLPALDALGPALRESTEPAAGAAYADFLSAAMTAVEVFEGWAGEIRRQAHLYLEGGGAVAGYKLVPKRASRKWIGGEKEVVAALVPLGARAAELYTEPELKSVAQMEETLKARKIALPGNLWHAVSSGTTIAHDDDGRIEATPAMLSVEVMRAIGEL